MIGFFNWLRFLKQMGLLLNYRDDDEDADEKIKRSFIRSDYLITFSLVLVAIRQCLVAFLFATGDERLTFYFFGFSYDQGLNFVFYHMLSVGSYFGWVAFAMHHWTKINDM